MSVTDLEIVPSSAVKENNGAENVIKPTQRREGKNKNK